jgi:hypothetical protein
MCGWALSSRPALAEARSIMRAKPAVVNGDPRSLTKTKGEAGFSRWSRRKARSSSPWTLDGVCAGRSILCPPDVEHRTVEVDLVPTQIADLGRPQTVTVGQQDHGGVAMTVAIALGGLEQRLYLGRRQMFPRSEVRVRLPGRTTLRTHCS